MTTALLAFQWANFVGAAAIVAVAVLMARRWRDARPLVAFPALWGVFGVIYYAAVLAGRLSPPSMLLWGAAHRTLAVVMVIGFLLALCAILAAPYPLPGCDEDDDID